LANLRDCQLEQLSSVPPSSTPTESKTVKNIYLVKDNFILSEGFLAVLRVRGEVFDDQQFKNFQLKKKML
jgi:hypothetical protein